MKKKKKINYSPYLFIAPAIIYICLVTLIPMLMALPISFTDWSALTPAKEFVGLANYKRILTDKDFWQSIWVMSKFFLYVPLVMGLGLMAAVLLNNKIKGMKIFRVLFYSPVVTATVAVAILFDWFYQPTFGLFNYILRFFGLNGIGWINAASTSVMSVMIFKLWKGFGASMLIYLAGLQDVPKSALEAASIDGANKRQTFFKITLPMLKPSHIYLAITNVIGVFMIFQETYMLKGPMNSTRTVVNYIFERGFDGSEMGYASAMSFVVFLFIMILTFIQFRITNKKDKGTS